MAMAKKESGVMAKKKKCNGGSVCGMAATIISVKKRGNNVSAACKQPQRNDGVA